MKVMRTIAVSLLAGLLAVMLPGSPCCAGDTKALGKTSVIQKSGGRSETSSFPDPAETPPENGSSNAIPYPDIAPAEDTTQGSKKRKASLKAPKVQSVVPAPAGNPARASTGPGDIPGGQDQDGWNARAAEAEEEFPSINSTPFPGGYLDPDDGPGEGKASERRKRLRTIPPR